MSAKNYLLTIVHTPDGKAAEVVQAIPAGKSAPVRMKALPGATYTLAEAVSERAPQQVHTRRRGRHLEIQLDEPRPEQPPDLVLEEFYDMPAGTLGGVAEDAQLYRFIPDTALGQHQIGQLADGMSITQVLGSSPLVLTSASPLVALAPAGAAGGLGAGAVAAGAGLLGLGAAGGGGGGGGPQTLTAQITSNVQARDKNNDGKLNIAEGQGGVTYTLTFNAAPNRELKAEDLQIEGGTLVEITPASPENPLSYSIKVQPNDKEPAGSIKLTLRSGMLTSAAGVLNASASAASVLYDTQALTASAQTNLSELEKAPGGKIDGTLNIAENKSGVRLTVDFNEKPHIPVDDSHFKVSGGSIRAGSLTTTNEGKTILFVLEPTPNQAGSISVSWSDTGLALTDQAGNPLTASQTSPLLSLPYDLRTPTLSITGTDGTQGRVLATSKDLQVSFNYEGPELDSNLSKLSLLGQKLSSLSSTNTSPLQISNALGNLKDGFYTLSFELEDIYGNRSVLHQVLEKNVNGGLEDRWIAGADLQKGDEKNNYFLDRPQSQIYDGGGAGSDVFVWLKAYAGTSSTTDRDRIENLELGQTSGASNKDVINLIDLLGPAPSLTGNNLAKFLQAMQVDKNNDKVIDETRLYINHLGRLNDTTNASLTDLESTATQVIVLEGINKSLNDLVNNGNLSWGAPVL